MDILVPVDFSKPSEAALLHACRLARFLGRMPLVLHVVHDPGEMPGYYSGVFAEKKSALGCIEDKAREMFADFLARAAQHREEIRACGELEALLVHGLPGPRIIEVAQHHGVGMIVIGSRGATGIKRLMTGSVAQQVVRLSPVPVTVVKT